jgi:hypothetical protein
VTSGIVMNPPKCDGSVSWTVFHRQFEALADQEGWAGREVTHLLAILQGQAADILLSAPAVATCEGVSGALKGRYGDHTLALALIIHSEDPAERLVVTGIHRGCQAVDPPGPCQTG